MALNFEYKFRSLNQVESADDVMRTPYSPPIDPVKFGQYSFTLLSLSFFFMSLFVM